MQKRVLVILLLIGTGLIFTNLALIAFLIFIAIIAISTSRSSSWLHQTVVVYLGFFCGLTMLSAIGWVADIKIGQTTILLGVAAVAWLVLFKLSGMKRTDASSRPYRLGLATAGFVCAFVSLPILLGPSSENVLRYAAKTGDDINHIARVEAIRNTGGLLYQRQSTASQVIDPGTAAAPQGWHYNAAFIESLIIKVNGSDSLSIRLLSYFLYKTAWLFIASYLIFVLMHKLLTVYKISGTFFYRLAAVGAGVISITFLVALYGYGFQNMLATIALICASLIIALNYIETTSQRKRQLYALGLILLAATTIYIWTLAGMIAGLIAFAAVVREFVFRYRASFVWWHALIAGIFGIMAALPLYVISNPGSQRGLETLNSGGAVPPIFIISTAGLVLATVLLIKKLKPINGGWLALLIFTTSLGFVVLAIYQQVILGEHRYYVVKLAFIIATVSATVFVTSCLKALSQLKLSQLTLAAAYMFTLLCLPLLIGLDLRKSAYPLKDSAPITRKTAASIIDLSVNQAGPDEVFNTSNKEESYLATKLWSDVQLYTDADRKKLLERMNAEINQ